MKKLRHLALALALVLTLAACAGQSGTSDGDDTTGGQPDPTTTGNQTHEHVFGEWTVKTAVTCSASGLKERVCACGETESETIPKAIHNYANGTCAACGKTQPQASEGLQFTLSDDGAGYVVSGVGTCTDSAIVLPDIYEGKPVIGIGEEAFFACESVTSVVISDYVTYIDRSAFYACPVLASVVIPGSVESIGESAFKSCSALTSITIPSSVTEIGEAVFHMCGGLRDITFEGTKQQWEAIEKGENWDVNTRSYTVHCTDGDIEK